MHRSRLARAALLVVAATLVIAACSAGPSATPRVPAVTDAWVRVAPVGADSAAYFTITNPGTTTDRLQSVAAADATMAQLHQTSTDTSTGMTGMTGMDGLEIGPGATVTLAPGGTHVMLMGVTRTLTAGASTELRLTFEHAGTITVIASVRPS